MKKHTLLALIGFAVWRATLPPAFGVSKEVVQMMQQLDQLQQSVQNLQKTVDTQSAVLKTLIEQADDKVNTMKATVDDLKGPLQQNLASTNARFDALASQIQALSESLDEAKSRLAKLSDQMAQTQNILQTLPAEGCRKRRERIPPTRPARSNLPTLFPMPTRCIAPDSVITMAVNTPWRCSPFRIT